MGAVALLGIYGAACILALLAAHRGLCPIRFGIALALAVLPFLSAGRSLLTGGFHGALNLSYATAPLQAQAHRLPAREYHNGHLSDIAYQMVPWKAAVWESLREGRLPFGNPHILSGDILLAAAQPAPFHPFTLAGVLLPPATAWTLVCALVLFLAALSAFLFARELGCSDAAALFGGAATMLSSSILILQGWPNGAVLASLPLLLLGLRRIAAGEPAGLGASLAAMLLMLLAGHGETTLLCVTGAGVYFLFELRRARRPFRAAGAGVLAGLLALSLAAPAILPFFEALPQTQEKVFRDGVYAHQKKSLPLSESGVSAMAFIYPRAFQGVDPKALPAPISFMVASYGYVGGLTLVLAGAGLASRRRGVGGMAAAGLLAVAVSSSLPVLTDLLTRLPWFRITITTYFSGVAAVCLCALAALGLDELLKQGSRRLLLAGGAAALLLLGVGLWWRSVLLARQFSAVPIETSIAFLLGPPLLLFAALVVGARGPVLAPLALATLCLTRLGEEPRYYMNFPERLFFPRIEELQSLPEGDEPYRTVGLGYSMVPNQSALFGLEDPRGYQAMTNRRYADTYPLWSVAQPVWFNRVDDPTRPFLSFLNVRFAVGDPLAAAPDRWRVFVRGPNAAIFENPAALPRAFVPRRVVFGSEPGSLVSRMGEQADFRERAWLEAGGRTGTVPNGQARVRTRREGSTLRIDVNADSPAWIVVSQVGWKGWKADLDGRAHPLHVANHAFLAAEVPAGAHRLRLRYAPDSFGWGVLLSLPGALFCLGALVRARRSRRAATPEAPAP
jgi:hypothetical protein